MKVAFAASDETVRLIIVEGFRALSRGGAAGRTVILREVDPREPGALEGRAALLFEIPDELLAPFGAPETQESGGRIFEVPVSFVERFAIIATRPGKPAAGVGGRRPIQRSPPPRRGARLLSGRSGLAIISALALAAMAVTAMLQLRDRSEEPKSETTGSLPGRGVLFEVKRLGIVGVRPPSWRISESRRAIRLSSPDRVGLVGVSATPSPVGAPALMASTLTAVGHSYRRSRLTPATRARVGGIAGRGVV